MVLFTSHLQSPHLKDENDRALTSQAPRICERQGAQKKCLTVHTLQEEKKC